MSRAPSTRSYIGNLMLDSVLTLLWRERPRNLFWKEPLLSFAPGVGLARGAEGAALLNPARRPRCRQLAVADYNVLTDDVLRTAPGVIVVIAILLAIGLGGAGWLAVRLAP